MRRYETIYILRPSLNEEEINTIVENSNAIITGDKGQVIELDRWGMRKLAYPIKKELQGFYVFCDYSGTPEAVTEMERKFRIDDAVLRYMTVKTADSISTDEITEATQQAATKQAEKEKQEELEEAKAEISDDAVADADANANSDEVATDDTGEIDQEIADTEEK